MSWVDRLSTFGRALLFELGTNTDYGLPTDHNPITGALAKGDFVQKYSHLKGFSRMAVSKVATLCQMTVFDADNGPEMDGERKGLRRHWYTWYKTKFSQPFAQQLGDCKINAAGAEEMNDVAWNGRLSQTYAWFVDNESVTYHDLWVSDTSRMMKAFYERLFSTAHIVIAVEKDSLLDDFEAAGKALGARAVISGKGKCSKAAIELLLRKHFNWGGNWEVFTRDNPLIILHISDHDYDGEAVIGPTFGNQARRYTPYILEARVGVKPQQVTDAGHDPQDRWYNVKVKNSAYVEWAEKQALFLATCMDVECGHQWPVVGVQEDGYRNFSCPMCGGTAEALEVGADVAHGYEVEALLTRDYYGLIVDALLRVLPLDYIIGKLRDECYANVNTAAVRVAEEIYGGNRDYQALLAELERLEAIKAAFEHQVVGALEDLGRPHAHDWRNDGDDPEAHDFRRHVRSAGSWASPWRPFNEGDRTSSLVEWLEKNAKPKIEAFEKQAIAWKETE